MRIKSALVVISVLASLVVCVPANAQFPCGDRSDFIKTLAAKYKESAKALGIANQTNLVEIFTSEKGTWTIMVTQPTGKTCIIAAGSSWEDMKPVLGTPALYKK